MKYKQAAVMVSACHTKVVQKHLSFLKLFQWTVKRFVSRKVTEVCYTYSFSFHSISVPKSAGELRLLGMEIKKHFLMLPENQITLSLQTLQFFSTHCGTTHNVPQMQYPLWGSRDSVRNRQVSREFCLAGLLGLSLLLSPLLQCELLAAVHLSGPHPSW